MNQYRKGRTTVTYTPSLFEKLLSGNKEDDEDEKNHRLLIDLAKQKSEDFSKTKSLRNLVNELYFICKTDIFYSKNFDYEDYKLSLKYNNKNLEKISLENIKNPHPKLIQKIYKTDLSSLIELKFKDIALNDQQFQVFAKQGGLQGIFPKIRILQVSGSYDLTSQFLTYSFVQQNQQFTNLDLSYTKIDEEGISYLSNLSWKSLTNLSFQWCSKLLSIGTFAQKASNFPALQTLDLRFTGVQNDSIGKLFNSPFSFTLKMVRVFGAQVCKESSQWDCTWLINQLIQVVLLNKKPKVFNILWGKDEQLFNEQKIVLQKIKETNEDKSQALTNLTIMLKPEEKVRLSIRWIQTLNNITIQFIEIPEQLEFKTERVKQILQFIQREPSYRQSVTNFQVSLEELQLNNETMDSICDTVAAFKEVKRLDVRTMNQNFLKEVSYYYIFQQVTKVPEIQYLQVFQNKQTNQLAIFTLEQDQNKQYLLEENSDRNSKADLTKFILPQPFPKLNFQYR